VANGHTLSANGTHSPKDGKAANGHQNGNGVRARGATSNGVSGH